jgi:hypothetical protein
MMRTLPRFFALALLSAVVAQAQVVLFNNMILPTNLAHGGYYVQGSASPGGRHDVAEQFQTAFAGPAFLTSAVVSLRAFGAAGVMSGTATLFSGAGGGPGSILETTSFAGNLFNNTPTLVTVTFSGSTVLSGGTNYWLGLAMQGGSNFWAQWNFAEPLGSNPVGLSPNGISWAISNATAAGLTVNGRLTAVPEPATFGIFGAGVLLGLAGWRRRNVATAG